MKREPTSTQNLLVASETTTDRGPGLVNSGFCQSEPTLNAPMAGQANSPEDGAVITISPAIGQEKRGDCQPDKLYTNNGEIKTENVSNSRILLSPNPTRMSQHTTRSSIPFAAFEMPETTVVPAYSMGNSNHKRKSNFQMQEAIPIMPLPVAVVCLMFNVVIPGSGQLTYFSLGTQQELSKRVGQDILVRFNEVS